MRRRLARDLNSSLIYGMQRTLAMNYLQPWERCLVLPEREMFPKSVEVSTVSLVFNNAGERSFPSQYCPINPPCAICQLFESFTHVTRNILCVKQYGFHSSK